MKKIKDYALIASLTIFVFIISSIPYQIGYKSETSDLVFKGIFYDPQDYAVHISMMRAGWLGEWTYQLRYTSEEHNPAFIRLFYIFLGHISRWTNINVEIMYQIARWLFGFSALFVIEKLFQKIFKEKKEAHFAFFLTIFGSGIGWLQLFLGVPLKPISPIDFWLIDAYLLFSLSLFPSFSLTLTLMVGALYLFIDFLENNNLNKVIWICLLSIVGQLFNPIAFATIDAAIFGTVLIIWWKSGKFEFKHGLALGIIGVSQIPLLIYNLFILTKDPIWSQFTLQNETLSPSPIFYLWGFAPFWIFAVPGIIKSIQERNLAFGAMFFWVLSGFVLAYIPVLIQRRFLLGITIPLGALGIYGLRFLINVLSEKFLFIGKRENLIQFAYILIASISSIFLILNSSLYTLTLPVKLYYPRTLDNAFIWLNENTTPNEFVLADISTSQLVAQKTGLKVYVGHEMETIRFEEKKLEMQAFFEGTQSADWLSKTRVRWVIFGPYERKIADVFTPPANLELVYDKNGVQIYRVISQ